MIFTTNTRITNRLFRVTLRELGFGVRSRSRFSEVVIRRYKSVLKNSVFYSSFDLVSNVREDLQLNYQYTLYVSPLNVQDGVECWFSKLHLLQCLQDIINGQRKIHKLCINIIIVQNKLLFVKRKAYSENDLFLSKRGVDSLNTLINSLYGMKSFTLKSKFCLDYMTKVIHGVTKILQQSISYDDEKLDPDMYADVCTSYIDNLKDTGELSRDFSFKVKVKGLKLPQTKGYEPSSDIIVQNLLPHQWKELCKPTEISSYRDLNKDNLNENE